MKQLILASAFMAGWTFASGAPALAAAKNYDCTKPGNANKAACKNAAKAMPAVAAKPAKAAPAKPKPAAATNHAAAPKGESAAPTMASSSKKADDHNPAGAIAQCKDGTYSHAKSHSGACSHHGGVAKWS